MVEQKDELPTFIPKRETKIVILGTMGSINARTINGVRPKEAFFYNNNRNHFWKVLQHLFEPRREPQKLTIKGKKDFLEKHGIAIHNIVDTVQLPNSKADDPSDDLLFKAQKLGKVELKKVSPRFRKILKEKPLFFTCRKKKGLDNLLEVYFDKNGLSKELINRIWYWPTPTRCNPLKRSLLWKEEMELFLKEF